MTTLSDLLADLDAEYDALRSVVIGLADDDARWDLDTPAEGWAIRDQVSHLAYFDDAGRLAMVDPDAFARSVDEVLAATGDPMDVHLIRGRAMGGDVLLAWWDDAHRAMVEAFAAADPSVRVPWYGPPMGVLSFISARLMETWAHGQDICDALGVERGPTARLHHIAHLGVRARPFSYLVRGREVPAGRIEVELTGPEGDEWRWEIGGTDTSDTSDTTGTGATAGTDTDTDAAAAASAAAAAAAGTVRGTALDFCMVVTQRRNVADSGLEVEGELAEDWISVAQAFAGPPGPGRPPA
jgi:uncharacterized protein (TIGR03084 family)